MEEHFDVLDSSGALTGRSAPRSLVHSEGLLHRAVHVWLFSPSTGELLLQERAACKDSWPGRWDVSSAGHVSAGGSALDAAVRELDEELGVAVGPSRLRFLYTHFETLESEQRGRRFINNEFNEVYLLEIDAQERSRLDPAAAVLRDVAPGFSPAGLTPAGAPAISGFSLQRSEVASVQWVPVAEAEAWFRDGDSRVVPCTNWPSFGRVFRAVRGEAVHDIET